MQAVTDAALAHLELDELLAVLLPRIRDILDADTCAVLLLDEEGDELVARAAVGIEEEVEQGVRIPLGRGFAGRVAATQQPVILDDVDHADVLNPILREKGIKSMLGVPLIVARRRDRRAARRHARAPRGSRSDDVELLQLVAERVALAIERARCTRRRVRLDQLKANFVAIASHELRTPATSVYGALATLVERGDELPRGAARAAARRSATSRPTGCAGCSSSYSTSRVSTRARSRSTRSRSCCGASLARSPPRRSRPDAESSSTFRRTSQCVADPLVLDRVVSNLLINAVRYGEPPFVARRPSSGTGTCGSRSRTPARASPEELRASLFERFARGETAHGTGSASRSRARTRGHTAATCVYEPGERGARFELILPQQS